MNNEYDLSFSSLCWTFVKALRLCPLGAPWTSHFHFLLCSRRSTKTPSCNPISTLIIKLSKFYMDEHLTTVLVRFVGQKFNNRYSTLVNRNRDDECDPARPCKAHPPVGSKEVWLTEGSLQMCFFHDGFDLLSNSYKFPLELQAKIQLRITLKGRNYTNSVITKIQAVSSFSEKKQKKKNKKFRWSSTILITKKKVV